MSLADAFLADIAEHAEDAPRLVYADWLDDNGDPARAEFIRVQVALAKLGEDAAERFALEDREAELLNAHEEEWLAELPGRGGTEWGPFVRGFVEEVDFPSSGDFLAVAPALFAVAPLRSLSIERTKGDLGWLQLPELRCLTELTIKDGLDAEGTRELAGATHLTNLRRLTLNGLDEVGPLIGAPHLGQLEHLRLHAGRLGPDELAALLGPSGWPNLTSLHLGILYDVEELLPVLGRPGHLARLTALGLSDMGHAAEELRSLLVPPHLAGLRALDLDGNELGDEAIAALALLDSPLAARLRSLVLTENDLGTATREALRQRLGNRVAL